MDRFLRVVSLTEPPLLLVPPLVLTVVLFGGRVVPTVMVLFPQTSSLSPFRQRLFCPLQFLSLFPALSVLFWQVLSVVHRYRVPVFVHCCRSKTRLSSYSGVKSLFTARNRSRSSPMLFQPYSAVNGRKEVEFAYLVISLRFISSSVCTISNSTKLSEISV